LSEILPEYCKERGRIPDRAGMTEEKQSGPGRDDDLLYFV